MGRGTAWCGGSAFVAFSLLTLVSPATAQMDTLPSGAPASTRNEPAIEENDPIESVNRKIFWFNDKLDVYVLEPVAKGWHFVLPDRVQTCITNFFYNLRFPIHTLNDTLQGKFKDAGIDVGRFLVNTTVGVAGFFDPATGWGLPMHWEDFGQTLGVWGAGSGPYLVLPLLGPSDIRDGAGLMVDSVSTIYPFFVDTYYVLGARAVEIVNTRAHYLDEIAKAKESALDYYVFVRNAYLQRRAGLINDYAAGTPAPTEEDIYHPEGQ
jgi:phospholipid-binding lipoprotein MlaA